MSGEYEGRDQDELTLAKYTLASKLIPATHLHRAAWKTRAALIRRLAESYGVDQDIITKLYEELSLRELTSWIIEAEETAQ